ncbi:MAG: SpoIIE family protein phosphatase [Rhodospirillales bacterium]|nr:SpoIIE family protein phosphatase [Rhodospirillales bacterium]
MRIRLKFLIMMLAVAVPPLIFVSWFDQRAMLDLGRHLVKEQNAHALDSSLEFLDGLREGNARLLIRERRLAETTLSLQSKAVAFHLQRWGQGSFDTFGKTILRETLFSHDPGMDVVGRVVVLHSGAGMRVSSGGYVSTVDLEDERDWFKQAIDLGGYSWIAEPERLVVATPILALSGETLGATSIELSYHSRAFDIELPGSWNAVPSIFLWNQASGIILVHSGDMAPQLPDDVMVALNAGASGSRVFDHEGRSYFLSHGPAGDLPLSLILVAPAEQAMQAAAKTKSRVRRGIEKQAAVSGTGLTVFALVAIVLAIIAARSITRPLKNLTEMAERVAGGDLNARADIETGDEIQELAEAVNNMIPKLRDRVRMRDALGLAMEVQQNLLPAQSPEIDGFDVAGKTIYCDETGGDYYDFVDLSELGKNRVGVAVGDVTGHGVAAALLMTTARALLRSRATEPGSLSDLAVNINRHLRRDANRGRFMTLFYGVIESASGSFRWVNAGHEPALLYNPKTDIWGELAGDDIPLGIDADWSYQEHVREIWDRGQIVVIGTDGVWETRNPDGEMFSRDRLRDTVRENAGKNALEICESITDSVTAFREGRVREDDATVVVIKAL